MSKPSTTDQVEEGNGFRLARMLCRWFGHHIEALSDDIWDFPAPVRCRRCGVGGTANWLKRDPA